MQSDKKTPLSDGQLGLIVGLIAGFMLGVMMVVFLFVAAGQLKDHGISEVRRQAVDAGVAVWEVDVKTEEKKFRFLPPSHEVQR